MKPSEFYVGILNFFAILLPGAIVVAILSPLMEGSIVGPLIGPLSTDTSKTATFFISAYFAGHFIFLLGSYIDTTYNELRRKLNPYDNESAFQCAQRLRDGLIDQTERAALNTFQWSRAVLIATCSDAAEDVHRLEADSKFFRSLLAVCVIAAVTFFVGRHTLQSIFAIALIVPCFARYYERRLKSTTQAYIHLLTLNRLGKVRPTAPS